MKKTSKNIKPITPGDRLLDKFIYKSNGVSEDIDKCLDCGGNLIHEYTRSSPDDYDQTWTCKDCGSTWST